MVLIVAVHILPMAITYIDLKRMPLYAFLWFFVGFAAVAAFTDSFLMKQFLPYLEPGTEHVSGKTEKAILEEMKKIDF